MEVQELKNPRKYKKYGHGDLSNLPYREGDIVAYPTEMRLVREEDHPSRLNDDQDEVLYEDDDEEDRTDDENDDEGRADDEDREEEDIYDEEDEEARDAPKTKKKPPPQESRVQGRGKFTTQDIFVMEKVKINDNPDYEQYVIDMGLQNTKYEFVKKTIKLKTEKLRLEYGAYDFMIYKKNKLVPYNPYANNKIVLLDEKTASLQSTVGKRENIVQSLDTNPSSSTFRKGMMIAFNKDGERVEGIITTCAREYMGVVPRGSKKTDLIFVKYDDPDLVIVDYVPKKSLAPLIKEPTVDDIYSMKDIPDDIRNGVKGMYYKILDEVRTKNGVLSPVSESTIKRAITMATPHKIQSFEEYWNQNFRAWLTSIKQREFMEQIDINEISRLAEEKYEEYADPNNFYSVIIRPFGDNLDSSTTLDNLLKGLQKEDTIESTFQAFVITRMIAEKTKGYGNMHGQDLGAFIVNIIQLFYVNHPFSIEHFFDMIYEGELKRKFDEYIPTEDETRTFEASHGEEIRSIYDKKWKEYELEIANYNKQLEEEETRKRLEEAENLNKKEDDINPFSSQNKIEVDRFEEIIFKAHGSSVYEYLKHVLYPQMFLEGPLAKLALYFRSKIADGSYSFSALVGANISYYFPELAMNPEVYPLEKGVVNDAGIIQEHIGNTLNYILHYNISVVVDTYINSVNPTAKMTKNPQYTFDGVLSFVESLNSYPRSRDDNDDITYISLLVDPNEICKKETNTGARYTISNGEYTLDENTGKKERERIPEDDLVICIDDKGNFACNSLRDIMIAISRGDHKNPITGGSYPVDLVDRVKRKYEKEIAAIKLPKTPERKTVKEVQVIETHVKTQPKLQSPKRERYVRPTKAPKRDILGILLEGNIKHYRLFNDEEFKFLIEEEGVKTEHTVYISDDIEDNLNVAVLSFDFNDQLDYIKDLKEQASLLPDNIEYIYVIGLNSKNIDQVTRQNLRFNIKRQIKSPIGVEISDVFYVKRDDFDDMRDGLIDVSISMEGVKVVE